MNFLSNTGIKSFEIILANLNVLINFMPVSVLLAQKTYAEKYFRIKKRIFEVNTGFL